MISKEKEMTPARDALTRANEAGYGVTIDAPKGNK